MYNMPINEYHCSGCKKIVETLEKMGEITVKCPYCLKPKLVKVISAGGFTFKGGKPT